jgi:hypothetical protein
MRTASLVLAALACMGALGTGCAHGPVTGRIRPEHFQFKTVVKPRKDDPAGWRAVCIHGRITHGNSGATDVCRFEVGLPIFNEAQGEIPLEEAQRLSAELANRAMYRVLSQAHPGEMLAVLCNDFKGLYEALLKEWIKGARVGQCVTRGVKVVHFGVSDGDEP